ncbi:conjugal transfer pilus assembly protein TraU [Escherichia coli]|nr:conjugal transfer pilus assembly protein TraU [Escherichia coli]
MTLAAITMTAPEAASPVQMYRATYSPDDNKLRLYAASRLDPETYKKVHDAGFRWAPKQALFVAPAWTPGREDVLLSLAGEIEDEDSTLAERQEARAERFTGYSGKRASESAQALDEVERLAAMIPPGQPILVGHHSERRARRDAQRIENGMKRAVMLFERAEYWEERARSALLHAKYKERPDVRWRRIKKIEADLRKAEKTIAQSQKYLTMWRAESLDLNMAKLISSHDHISACFPLDTYPRPAEKSQYEGSRSLWSALDDDIITTEQAREIAIRCHERQIQHQQRWVIAYLSEIDPTWTDSSLTTILNPEAVIFANPIAQGACAADAIASAFNMPLDVLFWCAGSQGSMYPFNGWVSNESSPLQSSLLVSERMAFKLHRQGMIMETIGKNNAVCNEYPSPILPKERWRYQMVNMYPDSGQCHPFGRSVMRWETGKNPPNTKKNFGYLMWRKRNCVFL